MSRRTFRFPVTFDAAARKKDRSLSLRFTTNLEVTNEDFAKAYTFIGESGWVVFSGNELTAEDIPDEDAGTREGKSKGQRMRGVWFLIWKKNAIEEPFESWYTRKFEGWMDRWKEELD